MANYSTPYYKHVHLAFAGICGLEGTNAPTNSPYGIDAAYWMDPRYVRDVSGHDVHSQGVTVRIRNLPSVSENDHVIEPRYTRPLQIRTAIVPDITTGGTHFRWDTQGLGDLTRGIVCPPGEGIMFHMSLNENELRDIPRLEHIMRPAAARLRAILDRPLVLHAGGMDAWAAASLAGTGSLESRWDRWLGHELMWCGGDMSQLEWWQP